MVCLGFVESVESVESIASANNPSNGVRVQAAGAVNVIPSCGCLLLAGEFRFGPNLVT